MPVRHANAHWEGSLAQGKGAMHFDAYDGPYTFRSRMEDGPGTNPEELLGAAHAGCFSMALAVALELAGFRPGRIDTRASVEFGRQDGGFAITSIQLATEAEVPNLQDEAFQKLAEAAKANCPVSKALHGTPIRLEAKLRPPEAQRRAG